VVYANAGNFNLKRKFDVIVAGDLIEHLFNVGSFIDSVKKHMRKNSILIITTPNAFSFRRSIGSLFLSKLRGNTEHVLYYSNVTIYQLLKRKGFKDIKIKYFNSKDNNKFTRTIEKALSLFLRKETRNNLLITAKL